MSSSHIWVLIFNDAILTAVVHQMTFSGFEGAINPLNNSYVVIPHELRSIAFLCNSSKIIFGSKKIPTVQCMFASCVCQ